MIILKIIFINILTVVLTYRTHAAKKACGLLQKILKKLCLEILEDLLMQSTNQSVVGFNV